MGIYGECMEECDTINECCMKMNVYRWGARKGDKWSLERNQTPGKKDKTETAKQWSNRDFCHTETH